MLQIVNLSMAFKKIGIPLIACKNVSTPPPQFPSKNFKNPFKLLINKCLVAAVMLWAPRL